MQNKNIYHDEIGYALDKLENISAMLRHYAQMLVTTTLVNLVVTMLLLSGLYRVFRSEIFALYFSIIPIMCGIFVVVLAFRFDVLKRDGDAYFEELSDELHGKKIKEQNEAYKSDSSLKARVIIRRYSNAASLPLIPGKFGPAAIAAINIAFSFLGALISARFY